jgi:hypothetical protein
MPQATIQRPPRIADMPSLITCRDCATVLHIQRGTFPVHVCNRRWRNLATEPLKGTA